MASSGRRRKVSRKKSEEGTRRLFSSSFSPSSNYFALIGIPSETSSEVGQWDLESLCCVFSPPPPSLLSLSCQWEKMSNAIMRQRVRWWAAESDWTGQRKEKEQKQQLVFQRVSWALVAADRETKTGGGERKIWISSPRGLEAEKWGWGPMLLHLDIEATI